MNTDPKKNKCWFIYNYLFLLISVLPLFHSCYEIGGKDHLALSSTPTIPSDPDPVSVSLASHVMEELKSSLSTFVSFAGRDIELTGYEEGLVWQCFFYNPTLLKTVRLCKHTSTLKSVVFKLGPIIDVIEL